MSTEIDTVKFQRLRSDEFLKQASKSLMILNSGAIIAVMSLLQVIYGNHGAAIFKYFAIISSFLFLAGAICSIWPLWSSYEYIEGSDKGIKASLLTRLFTWLDLGSAQRGAFFSSIVAFFGGVVFALFGVLLSI